MIEQVKTKEDKFYELFKDKFGYKNVFQSPKIKKVVLSVGVGKIKDDKRKLEVIQDRLAKISGQKAVPVLAKKSIATFKVRAGQISGYKVTLRGQRAYSFLDKVINIAIPRMKDFRGIDRKSVDPMGNLTLGIKEHIIFPETGDEELGDVFGLAITINTSAGNKDEAYNFLKHIGIPFKKEEK